MFGSGSGHRVSLPWWWIAAASSGFGRLWGAVKNWGGPPVHAVVSGAGRGSPGQPNSARQGRRGPAGQPGLPGGQSWPLSPAI